MSFERCHSRLRTLVPPALLFFVATFIALFPPEGFAQSLSIGSAVRVQNNVTGVVGGRSTDIADGSSLFSNELVKTDAASLARLTFNDQTNLSIGPSAQVKLDRFVFDASRSTSSAAISMSAGAFRFVTGNSDPRNFKLTTPAASIGIRGTILDIDNTFTKSTVVLVEGAALVCTRANGQNNGVADKPRCTNLTVPGQYVVVQTNGVISPALPGGPAVFQFANLCSGVNAEICATFKAAPTQLGQLPTFSAPGVALGGAVLGATALAIAQAGQNRNPPVSSPPPPPPPPLTPQTIAFAPLTDQPLDTGSVDVSATASSGLPVSFVAAGACTASGATISLVSPGQCDVTAFQNGDSAYAPAPSVTQSFNVIAGANTITFPNPGSQQLSSSPVALNAFADSGDAIVYNSVTPAICTVSGNQAVLVAPGTCTISANDAGNAFYPAAAQVSTTFAVGINDNFIVFPPPGDTPLNGGPVTLNAFAASGEPIAYVSNTPAICTISGASVTLVLVGTCSITASENAGNAAFGPAPPAAVSFQVIPSVAAPVASSFAVAAGYGVTTAIDLAPHISGAFDFASVASSPAHGSLSQSGTIVFYTPARGYSGPDSFTYTATSLGGTSLPATVNINVATRPDPAQDPDVIGLVAAEVGAMQRFGQAQIDNVGQRLDALHDDDTAPVTNGIALVGGSAMPGDARAYVRGLDTSPVAASRGINRAFPSPAGLPASGRIAPQFHIWTGGAVSFGNQSVRGTIDNHFTTSGVSVGIDTRLADGVKGGIAFGFGTDRSKVGSLGTRADSHFYSATAYVSWKMVPQTFLDATLGVGKGSFDTRRFVPADQVYVFGRRDGTEIFGSLALTYEQKWGAWKVAPYARLDAMRISLDASTESGSDIWALRFARLMQTNVSGVLGVRTQYPVEMNWGTLTPTARLEYRHAFEGSYRQMLNYADQPAGPLYSLTGRARARDTLAATLGLQGRTRDNITGSFEYQVSASSQKVESQTVRALLSLGF